MTVPTGNEVQVATITGSPAGGDFTFAFGEDETTAIAFDAEDGDVESALEALPSIAPADVAVTGSDGGPWTVTFGGALRNTDVPELVADGTGLTGGTDPDVEITTPTPGNPPVTERCYGDVSAGGTIANTQYLPGQIPAAGVLLVDESDYYG